MADLAARKADGRARDRRLAEIEGIATATDAATHHDEAGLRTANRMNVRLVGERFPGSIQLVEGRASEQSHGFLARRIRRALFQLRIHHFHLKCLLI
ncbi:hypothetical protein D9M70_566310 [compost metagenome]